MEKEKQKEELENETEYLCNRCKKFCLLINFNLEKQRCKNCQNEEEGKVVEIKGSMFR